MADAKLPVIIDVFVDFCGDELVPGLRSDIQRYDVRLSQVSKSVKERLYRENGKIVPVTHWNGPMKDSAMLYCRFSDHNRGEKIRLSSSRKEILESPPNGISVKLAASHESDDQGHNISDDTKYIVIITCLKGQKKRYVTVHPCSRNIAVFEDPRYGSASVKLEGNKYWQSVELDFNIPDKSRTNYFGENMFSYLVTKEGVKMQFDKSMYEKVVKMHNTGGLGRPREIVDNTIDAKEAEQHTEKAIMAEKMRRFNSLTRKPLSQKAIVRKQNELAKSLEEDTNEEKNNLGKRKEMADDDEDEEVPATKKRRVDAESIAEKRKSELIAKLMENDD
jgi:hypothetical protein